MKSVTNEGLAQLAASSDMSTEELEAFAKEERRNHAHASLGILPQRWLAYQWNIENRPTASSCMPCRQQVGRFLPYTQIKFRWSPHCRN